MGGLIRNTSVSSLAHGQWRVMPHPDHSNGLVTTRKMTPEEIEKYGPKVDVDKETRGRGVFTLKRKDDIMPKNKLNITTEELYAECKTHGINKEAARKIADKYGFSTKQVADLINNRGVKDMIKKENMIQNESTETRDIDEYKIFDGNGVEYNIDIEPSSLPIERFVPKTLCSKAITGITYELQDDALFIYDLHESHLRIEIDKLTAFAQDILGIVKILSETGR